MRKNIDLLLALSSAFTAGYCLALFLADEPKFGIYLFVALGLVIGSFRKIFPKIWFYVIASTNFILFSLWFFIFYAN